MRINWSKNRLQYITTTNMAGKSKKNILVKLVSTLGTGFFYVKKKNPKQITEKMKFRKYDPVARKHAEFKEQKLSS